MKQLIPYFIWWNVWRMIVAALLIGGNSLMANGLSITNLSRDSLAQTLTFDVQWYNSWRLDSIGEPGNWDAAWVFVKFQQCDATPNTPWIHGNLNSTLSQHNFGDLEPVLSDGSGTGLDTDLKGVMLRRRTNGLFGNIAPTTVSLHVPNMQQMTAYNVRVIGMEMVFVDSGRFDLGAVTYSNSFSATALPTDAAALSITSEGAITINTHASSPHNVVSLSASFPKGFDGFHLMKYEITQGQYATFLNTIAVANQFSHFSPIYVGSRNALSGGGAGTLASFYSTRPDRPQNSLRWEDLTAYLDWAALRPMTEMEYEKACRGTTINSILDEYAWGTVNSFQLTSLTAPENGTEIPANLPANASFGNTTYIGGDGSRGPVRVGIFALPTNTTREQSGAGYYAAMELSGNLAEFYVGVQDATSTTGSVNFTGSWGDGALSAAGEANQADWPTTTTGGYLLRGGSWFHGAAEMRVSSRSLPWNGAQDSYTGGRGGR